MIRLLVGLGNPGPEYEATRHNAGFWFVDAVAARAAASRCAPERGYFGLAARANVAGRPVWLLEPMTFMNLSGKSVAALARFFKIEPDEILVAHDELDLMPGQVKLKLGGSHAGHNGLKDIHAQLGSARLLAAAPRHRPSRRQGRGGRLRAEEAVARAPRGDREEHRAVARRRSTCCSTATWSARR